MSNAFNKFITMNQYIKYNEIIRQEYDVPIKSLDIFFIN